MGREDLDLFERRSVDIGALSGIATMTAGFVGAGFVAVGWSLLPIWIAGAICGSVTFGCLGITHIHFRRRRGEWLWQTESAKQERRAAWERRLGWIKRFHR